MCEEICYEEVATLPASCAVISAVAASARTVASIARAEEDSRPRCRYSSPSNAKAALVAP